MAELRLARPADTSLPALLRDVAELGAAIAPDAPRRAAIDVERLIDRLEGRGTVR